MSKYKVGDKFIVEIKEVLDGENGTLYRSNFSTLVFDDYGLDKLQKYDKYAENLERNHEVLKIFEEKYNKGLNDAWELVKRILGLPREDWYNIFQIEDCFMIDILNDFTYQQALAKIEAYEESKVIKVGDVVYEKDKEHEGYGVVTRTYDADMIYVLWDDGYVNSYKEEELVKTRQHIDIQHILEQIRGNE